ncbi:uncharacterized protein LOC134274650 [Saccostrea cucullata]|uniref:uncharacterized protein LOC134274650 n=1 Tax=Saccostrea cuccullata TaxID=36930 RepID=UPI002ED52BE1
MAGVTERDRAEKEKTKTNESSSRRSSKKSIEKKVTNEECGSSVLENTNNEERTVGNMSNSPVVPVPTPGMTEVMTLLKSIKENQDSQDRKIEKMNNRVDELYYGDINEMEEELLMTPTNQSDVEGESEPPCKKRKEEGETSRFRQLGVKYKVKEDCDENVDEELASMINELFREGLNEDYFNELLKSIKRPENCTALIKTRVNQAMWSILNPETRNCDSKFQIIQSAVIKASVNLTKLANKLNEIDSEVIDHLITLATDALALLGHTNKLINVKRKELHRPDLGREYYHLSSPSLPFSEFLYGDDVAKSVKEIQDVNRISSKVHGKFHRGNFRPFRARGRPYGRGTLGRPRNQRTTSSWGRWSNSSTSKDSSKNSKGERSSNK